MFKVIISFIALVGIILHAIYPYIKIDAITIGLLIFGLIPWFSHILEELEIPGGWKIKFNKKEELAERAKNAGLIADLTKDDETRYSFQIIGAADKNLALAGLRIELEKKLKEIADGANISTKMQGVGGLLQIMSDKELIGWEEKSVLSDIIGLLNQAVHGHKIDESSYQWAMDYGTKILIGLENRSKKIIKRKK